MFVGKIYFTAGMRIVSVKSKLKVHKAYLFSINVVHAFNGIVHAQTNFWNSPNAYFGQTPPGSTSVKFAPQLINDSLFFHGPVRFFFRWKRILLLQ
jgi:hypothetical protein